MGARARRFFTNLSIYLAFLAFFAFFFHEVAFSGATFAERDIARFYFPMWKFAAESLRAGTIPFWNPYALFGAPFAANPQTCVFYPATALFHLGEFTRMFNWYILAHLALAAFGVYVWLRDGGSSPRTAFVGALFFGLGGYAQSTINLTISLCSVAYFPLALAAFRRALSTRRFGWIAATSIVLLLQLLAGDPAVSYATVLALFLYSCYKRRIPVWLGTSAVFLGLSAFQVLNFVELLAHSNRASINAAEAAFYSLDRREALNILVPRAWLSATDPEYRDVWLSNAYIGLGVFALAAFAIWKNRRETQTHLALGLFGLSLAIGKTSWVYWLLHNTLPFFNMIRFPQRFLFLLSFAAACLAAKGLDRLRRPVFYVAAAAALFDLAAHNRLEPVMPASALDPPSAITERIQNDKGLFRVMGTPAQMRDQIMYRPLSLEEQQRRYDELLVPNHTMLHRFQHALGYDSVYLERPASFLRAYFYSVPEARPAFLDLMNVKYLAANALEPAPKGFRLVERTRDDGLFVNEAPMPRAFLVTTANVAQKDEILGMFGAVEADPREEIFVEDPGAPMAGAGGTKGEVSIEEYSPNRVKMTANAPQPSWLFFSDAYYPGWKAVVDGVPAPVYRANTAFRALFVGPGRHAIEWSYRPTRFWPGLVLSGLTGAALCVYGILKR